MNKKTLLYVAGTVAVVGLIVWYTNSQAKKRAMTTSSDKGLEETSNAVGQQIGTTSCSSPDNAYCNKRCQGMGGVYNENGDRTCWKNGQPITGGVFGGIGRATKSIR